MALVHLSLGSNMGDRIAMINKAMDLLNTRAGQIVSCSRYFQTQPWGYNDDSPYINIALGLKTKLSPIDLLSTINLIETEMGRIRLNCGYQARPIDIDIILFEKLIFCSTVLQIPHPRMQYRRFVLVPLSEIAPNIIHPCSQKTITQLLEECTDNLLVNPL